MRRLRTILLTDDEAALRFSFWTCCYFSLSKYVYAEFPRVAEWKFFKNSWCGSLSLTAKSLYSFSKDPSSFKNRCGSYNIWLRSVKPWSWGGEGNRGHTKPAVWGWDPFSLTTELFHSWMGLIMSDSVIF